MKLWHVWLCLIPSLAACGDNRALSLLDDAAIRDARDARATDAAPDSWVTSGLDAAIDAPDAAVDGPGAALVSLEVLNGDQTIRLGRTRQVRVAGRYSDDTLRDITLSALGTRYTVSQLSDVISCSEDGLITTLDLGVATLAVSNSGIVYSVSVRVIAAVGMRGTGDSIEMTR